MTLTRRALDRLSRRYLLHGKKKQADVYVVTHLDREIVVLMIVFWFWQTPHFWLLVDRYRDDYRRASYPQVFQTMPDTRYRLLILLWVWAYLVSILLIPLFLPVQPVTRGALAVLPVLLGLAAWRFRNRLFPLINASILLVMLILVIDRAIHP